MSIPTQQFTVVVTTELLIFENHELNIPLAAINRSTGLLCQAGRLSIVEDAIGNTVVCIFGVLRLLDGPYLVIGTRSRIVGKIFNEDVHQITAVTLINIHDNLHPSRNDRIYKSMVENLLGDGSFYFSYGHDLTRSCQSITAEKKDDRFDWALNMRADLFNIIKPENATENSKVILNWCVPIIRGFVHITGISISDVKLDYILISRKSRNRPGRRFIKRGANKKGDVANYVESEQIISSPTEGRGFPTKLNLSVPGRVTSFVQVRGSIPILWTQKPNLQWDPPVKLKSNSDEEQSFVLRSHFYNQTVNYLQQTVVSLIKFQGNEGFLSNAFTKYLESNKPDNINYVRFDLQKEVGHTKYQNLQKLYQNTDSMLNDYGYFSLIFPDNIPYVITQTGTLRTNCKDNLDRTNLVQSRFAMQMARKQITNFLPPNYICSIMDLDNLDAVLRIAWADNGDALSIQYAGTCAIRSDHTRTGKASFRGLWNDAFSALTRYFINNFEDGTNQDALDIVCGNKTVTEEYRIDTSNYRKMDPLRSFLSFIFSFFFKTLKPSRQSLLGYPLCFFWMVCVFLVWKLFFLDPNRIVDLPRLKNQKKSQTQQPEHRNNNPKSQL